MCTLKKKCPAYAAGVLSQIFGYDGKLIEGPPGGPSQLFDFMAKFELRDELQGEFHIALTEILEGPRGKNTGSWTFAPILHIDTTIYNAAQAVQLARFVRVCEEAIAVYETSEIYGFTWTTKEVQDVVDQTLLFRGKFKFTRGRHKTKSEEVLN